MVQKRENAIKREKEKLMWKQMQEQLEMAAEQETTQNKKSEKMKDAELNAVEN